jgi:hypothetical protein
MRHSRGSKSSEIKGIFLPTGVHLCEKKTHLILLLILVLILAHLLPSPTAGAVPIEVTNTNNSGPGSLRQAITDANNNPGIDGITFSEATNGIPIQLTGSTADNANIEGDLDILDGGDLTIMGNGAANTIIDGGGTDRVFHTCPAGSCTNTVTLSNLTIQNGDPGLGHSGGGLYNNGSTVNIIDSLIGGAGNGNQASAGGGLSNVNGTMTLDATIVSANTALGAGGIYNKATLNIQNGSVVGGIGAGNQAINGDGGGILNAAGGTITIDNSTVSANSATDDGGGILNRAGLIIQNGTTIEGAGSAGNTSASDGGGIYNETGTTTIDDSTVRDNTAASYGGGIFNQASLSVINGSTLSGNTAQTWDGGGIYNDTNGTLTVDASTISANTAGDDAGGIFNNGTLDILNGSTIGGIGEGNTCGDDGGGISNFSGTLTIDRSSVIANQARSGGGIYNWATLVVRNSSSITHNTSTLNGGGGLQRFRRRYDD